MLVVIQMVWRLTTDVAHEQISIAVTDAVGMRADACLCAQKSAEPLPPISSDDWDELQRLADEQQEQQRQEAQQVTYA